MAAKWAGRPGSFTGPTIDDCERLWTTIIKELVTDCEIVIKLPILPLGQNRPAVMVISPGLDPETGEPRMHTWATRDVNRTGDAFSYAQLFDLLMTAYRNIDAHLNGQVPMALP